MRPIDFFQSHAGKAVVGVVGSVFLIAWPPAFPWIAAVALLQFGVRHLVLAFRELDRETQAHVDAPALNAPNRERSIVVPRHGVVPTRPSLD
jgi:hypothetical protein